MVSFLFGSVALAAPLPGCPGAFITGPATTFCVTDSGYSNTWFSGNPPQQPFVDFNLLGDSAQFLVYQLHSGPTIARWLSPTVDGGATGTAFITTTAVSNLGPDEASSQISDGTVSVDIDSKVILDNIKQTFTVTNLGLDAIDSMMLIQYFHYFPYGSSHPSQGALSYELVPTLENTMVLGLWAHGLYGDANFVREGGVCGGPGAGPGIGCSTPDHYMIDSSTNVLAVINGTHALTDGQTLANMDSAGALSWSVGSLSLGQGQSQAFTIELLPEPSTFGLMIAGGLVCWYKRRKR